MEVNHNGHAAKIQNGSGFGSEGVDVLTERAAHYCSCERQRIQAANQPNIIAAEAELGQLKKEQTRLQQEIGQLPPDGDLRARRRKSILEWVLAVFLLIAGFAFALVA